MVQLKSKHYHAVVSYINHTYFKKITPPERKIMEHYIDVAIIQNPISSISSSASSTDHNTETHWTILLPTTVTKAKEFF